MFSMFGWPIGRAGRITAFLWQLLGSLGFGAIELVAFGRADLTVALGFRFGALAHPLWYAALEAAFNLALLVVIVARLHDINRSGWWLLVFVGLFAAAVALPGAGFLAIVGIVLWLALLFWPGTFGPNAYGPHPLGWESHERYEAPMRKRREQLPPGRV